MKKLLFILLLCCSCSVAFATPDDSQSKQYRIDLLVFTHVTDQALQSERWSNRLQNPDIKNAQSPANLLPPETTGLSEESNTLNNTKDYTVIYHQSWIQPIDNNWTRIQGGQAYDANGQAITTDQPATPRYWQLDGKIKITKGTFFNIYTNLYLTMPESIFGGKIDHAPTGNFQPIPLVTFTLETTRHTRLKELNYLDHPLFGALIKITPMESGS